MAESVGMNVVYYDPKTIMPNFGNARRVATQDELLAQSDIVTLHVPENNTTRNMINAETIDKMKPGAYIINAARGGLVDYDAVIEALGEDKLGGIAVDVFVDEPKKKDADFEHPLRGNPKAVLTPHIAGSTIESQTNIAVVVTEKIIEFWQTGDPYASLTLPKPRFEVRDDDHQRVTFIHDDKEGAMMAAQTILFEAGCNIVGQNLKVDPDLACGSAYFDIDRGEVTPEVINKLEMLEVTRTARRVA